MRLLLFVTVVALCACGQSGALYLPESQSPASVPSAPATPVGASVPAEGDKEDQDADEGGTPATTAPVEPAP